MGAGNPSTARSVVGWVFELSWLAFLTVAVVGWVVPKSGPSASNSTTDVAERRAPLGVQPRRRHPRIPCARLTRSVTAYPAAQATFTVVDLETTGLDPDIDRIVEIGLVKFSADGRTIDEFATLVNNPGSSREAIGVHRILDSDLAGAPRIEDVLRETFSFISGTVLVRPQLRLRGRLFVNCRVAGRNPTAGRRRRLHVGDVSAPPRRPCFQLASDVQDGDWRVGT
ncbi:3'-5' exonuclease [Mycobacterium interjectum]|uniref:3'-5' exonuclease n=1 Tax=Mycobacterium interjectum TaxID=33895 RepID=UPI00135870D1|nr:3'-5' exonuclease [Mycobacterium interjectum]